MRRVWLGFLVGLLWGCSDSVTRPQRDGPRRDSPGVEGLAADVPRDRRASDQASTDAGPKADLKKPKDGPTLDSPRPADVKPPTDGGPSTKIWSTAYYAGWMQGALPPGKIDYGALSLLIHFGLIVNANGTLDDQGNSVSAANATAAVQAAHTAGKKISICVGGWGSSAAFKSATSTATRPTFISNLVNLMISRNYDGIDIDWEPMSPSDSAQYTAFISELRTAMAAKKPGLLLTAAVGWEPSVVALVASELDQINIMTYDMSGAWSGWVSWHNAPIYTGGCKFPSTGGAVPCADATVQIFLAAGVPAKKLGIGIDFYGYVWSGGAGTTTGGVTQPCQAYTSDPTVAGNVSYAQIMSTYYQASYAKWDSGAQAAYLSVDAAGSANDKFISYDNEQTVAAKVAYAKTKGLGGVFVWELGGGFRSTQPAGQQDLLLQSLKTAVGP
jgi:chitinase